jgi:hypothetical protein
MSGDAGGMGMGGFGGSPGKMGDKGMGVCLGRWWHGRFAWWRTVRDGYIRNIIRPSSEKNCYKDGEPPSRLEPIQRSRKLSCLYRMSGESK